MKKILRTIQGEITSKEPLVVVLPDNVEGPVKFNFYLKENRERPTVYTELQVVAADEANISLFNMPGKRQMSVKEDIPVGTYQNRYNLFVNFVLLSKTPNEGSITINFFIEEK